MKKRKFTAEQQNYFNRTIPCQRRKTYRRHGHASAAGSISVKCSCAHVQSTYGAGTSILMWAFVPISTECYRAVNLILCYVGSLTDRNVSHVLQQMLVS